MAVFVVIPKVRMRSRGFGSLVDGGAGGVGDGGGVSDQQPAGVHRRRLRTSRWPEPATEYS